MPVVECPYPDCTYATGDITEALAITMLTIHGQVHTNPPAPRPPSNTVPCKAEKVRRPTISAAGTAEDWTYFNSRWTEYKAATGVAGRDLVLQLLECCDEELRKDLTRNAGGSMADQSEEAVLAAIKVLAVRQENVMVARDKLWQMQQDHGEPIRTFGARLRGQASMCNLAIPCATDGCTHPHSYMEQILRDVLIRGLADPEIRLAVLQDTNQDMSLEEAFKFVEAKEAGKRSVSQMLATNEVAAAGRGNRYRQPKKPNMSSTTSSTHVQKTNNTDDNDCLFTLSDCLCFIETDEGGEAVTPDPPADYSSEHSSAVLPPCSEHTSTVTGTTSPFIDIDRSSSPNTHTDTLSADIMPPFPSAEVTPLTEEESTIASLSPDEGVPHDEVTLDHHVYDPNVQKWIKKPSKPQPFLTLNLTAHPDDYAALGLPRSIIGKVKSASLQVMADTGCQSCLISYKLLRKLGIYKKHLVLASMRMKTATCGMVDIIGCVVLRLSGTSASGVRCETRQIVYVTEASNKLFLSREACVALGLVSSNFPAVGENLEEFTEAASSETATGGIQCDCPRRSPPPPPPPLPFPATKENRGLLEKYLLDYYASSAFNTCTHQPLNLMDTPLMRLMIDDDANPVVHHNPIPIPLHWQDEIKAILDAYVRMGVMEKVEVGEPVTWLHLMVIAEKKSGKPRITVDLQPLNKHAIRETHHTQSPFHLARSIPHNTVKTVFDCWNGYHSLPLHPDDRHLTTFITPWGRYRYCVGPQGYAATGDAYTRRLNDIVADIQRKAQCIDDTCLWDNSITDAYAHAVEWPDTCARYGITLNPEKFIFAADTVEFAGFEISPDNVRPCQKSLNAILDFPTPANITDMRSWFGLLNQVAYAFSVTEHMQPFRHLLKPDTPFHWTDELDSLFEESKLAIVKEIEEGVRIYDKTKPTCLATDWSKTGIGFWLYQKHCHCVSSKPQCCPTGWKVAMVGSRFTQPAESRYAPVEGEALAVAYALEKAKFFVLGCTDLTVAVDHKPLLNIFSDRSLDMPNGRLRGLKEKTLRYRFSMLHVPGLKNKAADALSRHPSNLTPSESVLDDDIASLTELCTPDWHYLLSGIYSVEAVDTLKDMQAITWNAVKTAMSSDKDMLELLDLIEDGFDQPHNSLPLSLRPFHQFREDLSTVDGVALYRDRVIIPPSLRADVLNVLHAAHQGVTSMLSRVESSIFWPGITPAVIELRERCQDCNRMAPSQPAAPPTPTNMPTYPFQNVCADFFKFIGKYYLVIVDRYSNWPIVERCTEGAKGLIDSFKRTFMTFGIPDEVASDGGPEFTAAKTKRFLSDWGIDHHRQSSVAFPHSNCRAEIGVKTVKRLITSNTSPTGELNTDAFRVAMLQYRNTPDPTTKLSPAMCVFGRPIKDFIPVLPGKYQPHPTWQDSLNKREDALRIRHMKAEERWSEHTKRLPPLQVGDTVRIQNQVGPQPTKWDKTGTVIEVRQFDQYIVRIDGSGRATLRNRRFLRRYLPVQSRRPRTTFSQEALTSPSPFQQSSPASVTALPQPPFTDVGTEEPSTPMTSEPVTPDRARTPSPVPPPGTPTPMLPELQTPGQVEPTTKRVPLALRRLASFNQEGKKGLGEYIPSK